MKALRKEKEQHVLEIARSPMWLAQSDPGTQQEEVRSEANGTRSCRILHGLLGVLSFTLVWCSHLGWSRGGTWDDLVYKGSLFLLSGVHTCKGNKDAWREAAAVSQAEMGWLELMGGDVAGASNLGLWWSQESNDWVTGGMWGVWWRAVKDD